MTAVEPERILQVVEPRPGGLVTTVDQPAVGLQQNRGAQKAIARSPVARAAGGTAETQDALIVAVELGALLRSLQTFPGRGG